MSSAGAADTKGSSQWWGRVFKASWPGHSFPAGCPHLEKHSREMEAQLPNLVSLLQHGFLALCPFEAWLPSLVSLLWHGLLAWSSCCGMAS